MVGLESGGMPYTGRGTARWHVNRSSEKLSKREEQAKKCQEDVQNTKRSVVEYRDRESKYA